MPCSIGGIVRVSREVETRVSGCGVVGHDDVDAGTMGVFGEGFGWILEREGEVRFG